MKQTGKMTREYLSISLGLTHNSLFGWFNLLSELLIEAWIVREPEWGLKIMFAEGLQFSTSIVVNRCFFSGILYLDLFDWLYVTDFGVQSVCCLVFPLACW